MCPLKNINIKNFRSFMIIYSTHLNINEVFKAPALLQENDILEKRRKYICESESRKGRKIREKSWASL